MPMNLRPNHTLPSCPFSLTSVPNYAPFAFEGKTTAEDLEKIVCHPSGEKCMPASDYLLPFQQLTTWPEPNFPTNVPEGVTRIHRVLTTRDA